MTSWLSGGGVKTRDLPLAHAQVFENSEREGNNLDEKAVADLLREAANWIEFSCLNSVFALSLDYSEEGLSLTVVYE